ncbi:MAG TPA: replicative DNA helicase [bacterium]|jgi:replicative DNA helicase|nr:replicative DNA helicase [bacterium]
MLLDRDAIARVVEMLRPEDFYRDAHRRIYDAVVELFERGEPVDLITITDRLRDKGQLDDVGGASYVTGLLNSIPTAANVEYYARIVLQKSMLRQLIAAGTQITHLGFEGENDVELLIDRAEKLVFSIADRRMLQQFLQMRDLIVESFGRIEQRFQKKQAITGVPTGFYDLDIKTGGLQPSDLIIVAARPGMGKCLKYDAEVTDAKTGEVCTIQEIVGRKTAALWAVTEHGTLTAVSPSQFVDDGIKPVYRVRTGTGREVETTLSHPFLTPHGWRRLEDLRAGDAIAVPGRLPVFGQLDLPAYEVKLLAYLFAGTMPTSAVLATDYADAVAVGEAIRSATRTVRDAAPPVLTPGEGIALPVEGGSEAEVVGVLRARYPALSGPADQRHLPALIFTLLRSKVQLLLSRLLACVSTVKTDPDVVVRSVFPSARMARQVQHLLLRFGIFATRQEAALVCSGDVARSLFREVGVLGWERLRTWARHDQGRLLADGDLRWDAIATIEYIGDVHVYDLTIPVLHNFVANDVCVHNTTLALNIAQHAAIREGTPIAIFSLETSSQQLVERLMSSESGVDGTTLRSGFLKDEDWQKLSRAMGRLSEAPIYIDDASNISVLEMRAKARKLKAEKGLGLIVIDYIQLIQSYKRTENRTQEISDIARSLKSLAKELRVPIIAISQLSRAAELTGKRPQLSHLRESGEIEQVADLVLFIYREDYYDPNTPKKDIAEIIIAKHRNGQSGINVELLFQKETTLFRSIDKKH